MSRRSLVYLSVVENYNPDKIIDTLNKFKNVQRENQIITTFDGKLICRVDVSDVYYNFGFSKFCMKIVGQIENYFTPIAYRLRVKRGVQELKLVGGEVEINGEAYYKMLAIVNSTNKQRALSMNIGLIRKENAMTSVQSYFRNKHYKSSLPDKIKNFAENLINFNMDVEYQIQTIENLSGVQISFVELIKKLSTNKDGELMKSMVYRIRAFAKVLETKGIGTSNLDLLHNPLSAIIVPVFDYGDFQINAYDAYSAYLSLFIEYDSSVAARETRRILNALGSQISDETEE